MVELDYGSGDNSRFVSTEGCFACKTRENRPRKGHKRSYRKGRRSKYTRTHIYTKQSRRHGHGQQRSKRGTDSTDRVSIKLSYNNTRPSRPILFLQPSLAESLVNHTIEYRVLGKDGHLFEMKNFGLEPTEGQVGQCGLWSLHYREIVLPSPRITRHHLRIIGRQMHPSSTYYVYKDLQGQPLELDLKLRIIIN